MVPELIRERLDRLRLLHFVAALFAGATVVVDPEVEHGLAEGLHDVGATSLVSVCAFSQRVTTDAPTPRIENERWLPPFSFATKRDNGC